MEKEEILRTIEGAEALLASDQPEASLLMSWAATEAALRLLSEARGVVTEPFNPLYTLKEALANGIITRSDYNKLVRIIQYRNSLAHGFQPTDFVPGIVEELIKTTKRLMK